MRKFLIFAGIWAGGIGAYFAWGWFNVPKGHLVERFGTLPEASQVQEFPSSAEAYNLSYWAMVPYPAQEAFDHYDKALGAEGYRQAVEWEGMGPQRRWTTRLVEGKDGQNTCVAQSHAAWLNRRGNRMILLTLNYYDQTVRTDCPLPPKVREVFVLLQDIPTPQLQGNAN